MVLTILKFSFSLASAIVLGGLTGITSIKVITKKRTAKNGHWGINLNTGSKEANFYERASVAVAGLFGLNKTEVIYFTTFRDDQGRLLDSKNSYRLEGKNFDARWWSITTYGHDHYLIPNELNRYSYNGENIVWEDNDSYKIQLSTYPQKGNWLPVGAGGIFSITLRLYNPAQSIYDHPTQIDVPKIIKEAA